MREAEKVEREELRAKLAQAKRLQAFRDWVQQERVRQAEMAAIQQRELEARLVSLHVFACPRHSDAWSASVGLHASGILSSCDHVSRR